MYLLTPKTDACKNFFKWNVPSELRHGGQVYVDFKSFYEIVDALKREGLEADKDYQIE